MHHDLIGADFQDPAGLDQLPELTVVVPIIIAGLLERLERLKALAQIGKVIGCFKVKRLSAHRVDKVTVHRFVRPTDRRAPPLPPAVEGPAS
jgi:hypothetical protein